MDRWPTRCSTNGRGHQILNLENYLDVLEKKLGAMSDLLRPGGASARLCHLAGGELEQIQFLLGHVSVQMTERYLGCKQKLWNAVNDGIELAGC